jgi:hypothetical protein
MTDPSRAAQKIALQPPRLSLPGAADKSIYGDRQEIGNYE